MNVRRIIFWCHLPIGVTGGLIILMMSVTGVLLTYEKQIIGWADTRNYALSPGPSAERRSIESLLEIARRQRPAAPTAITIRSDVGAPAEIAFGRETPLFVDPYTGAVLGDGAHKVRSFFRRVTEWHRWLGAQGENRTMARAITGACNLGFLLLVLSGIVLWWPKNWRRKQIRNSAWFRRNLPARARDFNWHNVIGFWSAIPLFIVIISAVPISYSWAGNLVYRVTGETPPAPRGQATSGRTRESRESTVSFAGLDHLLVRAESHTIGWQSITVQIPSAFDAPVIFNIDQGNGGQPQKRAQLTLSRTDGEVVRWEPFSSYSKGRQLRSILRFAHTGEVGGFPGQTIAGIASAGAVVLVWTGLALALRRFRSWLFKRLSIRGSAEKVNRELGEAVLMEGNQ
jgi:uncharacterized iron-regulated membrane protein